MVEKSNTVDLEDPALEKSYEDNQSVASGSDYLSMPVDFADSLCNVTLISKMESCNNSQGCYSNQPKTFGVLEMMQVQMRLQALEYQHDWAEKAKREQCDQEENAIQEKRQLDKLKEA
jgi:hypothetical protein